MSSQTKSKQRYVILDNDCYEYTVHNSLKEVHSKIEEILEDCDQDYINSHISIFPIGNKVDLSVKTEVRIKGLN